MRWLYGPVPWFLSHVVPGVSTQPPIDLVPKDLLLEPDSSSLLWFRHLSACARYGLFSDPAFQSLILHPELLALLSPCSVLSHGVHSCECDDRFMEAVEEFCCVGADPVWPYFYARSLDSYTPLHHCCPFELNGCSGWWLRQTLETSILNPDVQGCLDVDLRRDCLLMGLRHWLRVGPYIGFGLDDRELRSHLPLPSGPNENGRSSYDLYPPSIRL